MPGDDTVAATMAARASELAGTDVALDYSLASLATVAGMLGARVLQDAALLEQTAAYVGEVIRRCADEARWAARPRRVKGPSQEPCIQWRGWFADPFDIVRRFCADDRKGSLRQGISELAEYMAEPTEATVQRLGWTTWWGDPPERGRAWRRKKRS